MYLTYNGMWNPLLHTIWGQPVKYRRSSILVRVNEMEMALQGQRITVTHFVNHCIHKDSCYVLKLKKFNQRQPNLRLRKLTGEYS